MKHTFALLPLFLTTVCLAGSSFQAINIQGYGIWGLLDEDPHLRPTPTFLSSRAKGEEQVGTIETPVFKITVPEIELNLRGWDTQAGGAGLCKVELIDTKDDSVLLSVAPPQGDEVAQTIWNVRKFKGTKAVIRITDQNDNVQGFAWIGVDSILAGDDLQLNFNESHEAIYAMNVIGDDLESMDFYGMPFRKLKNSAVPQNGRFSVKVDAKVRRINFLGMSNSIDQGCPVWAPIEHYSQRYFIGDQLGEIIVNYADGSTVKYPLTLGDSLWWGGQATSFPEPFASDEDAAALLANSLKLFPSKPNPTSMYMASIAPEKKKIQSLEIVDFIEKDGVPVVLGITLETAGAARIPNSESVEFNGEMSDEMDTFFATGSLEPEGATSRQERIHALRNLLYTTHENFPKSVPLSKPEGYRGPEVSFEGNEFAQVLVNMFYHNLKDMDDRIDETGFYHTSAKGATSWGSYFGFGQWLYGFNSYHLHTWARDMGRAAMELMALGMIDKGLLNADYAILQGRVWEEGLEIEGLRILDDGHPAGHPLAVGPLTIDEQPLPYHWNRILNIPNNHFGCFDNDSHGLTMMEMYNLWKRIPNRKEWLKPRWKYLVKAADWIESSGNTKTRRSPRPPKRTFEPPVKAPEANMAIPYTRTTPAWKACWPLPKWPTPSATGKTLRNGERLPPSSATA